MRGVSAADVVRFCRRVEQLAGVLADRLEHAEALAVDANEALVDERAERVEISTAHLLDRLERAASGEDGEAAEERPLVVVEELDAPADRVAQRSMPSRRVARPGGEELEAPLEAREHRRGDSSLARAAASSIASGRQSRWSQISAISVQVGVVRLEVRAYGASPLEEHGRPRRRA